MDSAISQMSLGYLSQLIKSILLFLRTISITNFPKKEVFFVIGIDTEQDVDKKYVHTGEYRNIREGIPRLLDIFDDFKAKPTWFITPDVAQYENGKDTSSVFISKPVQNAPDSLRHN